MGRRRIVDDAIYDDASNEEERKKCDKAHRFRMASRKCYEKDPLKKGAHYVRKRLASGQAVTQKTLDKYKEYLRPDELAIVSEIK